MQNSIEKNFQKRTRKKVTLKPAQKFIEASPCLFSNNFHYKNGAEIVSDQIGLDSIKPFKSQLDKKSKRYFNQDTRQQNDHKSFNFTKAVKLSKNIKYFTEQLKTNLTTRNPVDFNPFQQNLLSNNKIFSFNFQILPMKVQNLLKIIKIVFMVMFLFIMPLSLKFKAVRQSSAFMTITILGLILTLSDLKELFENNEVCDGLKSSSQIFQLRRNKIVYFCFDAFTLVAQIIALIWIYQIGGVIFQMLITFKVKRYFKYISELELELLSDNQIEKYWDLCKILLVNLIVCHILACFLLLIVDMNEHNWMSVSNIYEKEWFQQYIWSYYFGIAIIFTIGFGELHAVNQGQAAFVIFISMFSWIFFGYNINIIGNIINSIRQIDEQKNKKLRVLSKLSKKFEVSIPLKSEIKNFIIEQSKIKKQFNELQEKKLIKALPEDLKSSFLQQANQRLFQGLQKLIPLSSKSIEKLSERIEAKICHPGQFIKRINDRKKLIILRSGQAGFTVKRWNKKHNDVILERINCNIEGESKIICIDILQTQNTNYQIKSLDYSIIYQIDQEKFQSFIRNSKPDLQIYRRCLDSFKNERKIFYFNDCNFCQNKHHSLIDCSKLHFCPFKNFVSLKSRKKQSNFEQKQKRKNYLRCKKQITKLYESDQQHDFLQRYGDILEVQNSYNRFITNNSISINRLKSNQGIYRLKSRNSNQQRISKTFEMINLFNKNLVKKDKENQQFQFDLWPITDCDVAYDFQLYFPQNNPKNIGKYTHKKVNEMQLKKNTKMSKLFTKNMRQTFQN